jgi:DNA-binding MarR family transcriptional regulator
MQALVKGKATTMKELVKTIGLSQSTMSGIVDRLVERGLVLRKKNPKDKRAVVLAPSKEVQTFIRDRMQHLVLSPLLEALGKGSESDHAKIFEGLKTLENLLSRAGQ